MSGRIALEVGSLRLHAEGPSSPAGLGDRGLFAVKAIVLLVLAVGALLGSRLPVALSRSVVARQAGVELPCPAGWGAEWTTALGAFVSEKAGRQRGARRRETCNAFVMRLSFEDYAELHHLATRRSLGRGWHDDEAGVVSAVAAHFNMDAGRDSGSADRVWIADRPAAMVVSRCRGRWAAVVVAPAEDLILAGVCAPTARDLERVWTQWMAMIAGVRLPEPVRLATGAATEAWSD